MRVTARCVAITLLAFGIATVTSTGHAQALSVEQVVKKAKPATVFIVVATNSGAQSGTGFVVQSGANSTTIITANHVIEGESHVDVIFDGNEKRRYSARIVRSDHVKDVAVLKVHLGHRPTLTLESPDSVIEGMQIVLIGYPLATLEFHRLGGDALRPSVHTGIVSAIRYNGAILQFDAASYPGDSGGPIIDTDNGRVVAIVHGAVLDPSYAVRGLEQTLPGSSFGPSSATIASVMYSTGSREAAPSVDASRQTIGGRTTPSIGGATSASYRVGYGVPHEVVSSGNVQSGNEINSAVENAALARLQAFLRQDNSLYLIPVSLDVSAVTDPQRLSGYCEDNRLSALVFPSYAWNLTGGPRYNMYGRLMGYSGYASVQSSLFVFDCYGDPVFVEAKNKSENRYFAHRTPDREIVDMTNDLLSQMMNDFGTWRTSNAGAWQSLLRTGVAIDPSDTRLHSMLFFVRRPEGYQVFSVAPNGPADRAGVKAQDILETINGQSASGMTQQQIIDTLNSPIVTLVVERPGGEVTVTIHPQPYADIVQELQH